MKQKWKVAAVLVQPLAYISVVFLCCSILYLGKKEQIQKDASMIRNFFSLEATDIDIFTNRANSLKLAISQAITERDKQLAAQVVKEQFDSSNLELPSEGTHYGNIFIDRLGMEVPLYYGDNNTILRKGAGQYTGSSLPGQGSQILICAHNTSYFKPLQHVEDGDTIRVVTNYGAYTYQITEIRIAAATDTSTYNLSLNYEQLVLYTCYPFTGPPGKTQRYFVYADRVL